MKTYRAADAPLGVFGIPFFAERRSFSRLPLELQQKLPGIGHLARRCPGARIGFRTDAREMTVRVSLKTLTPDIGMSIYACQSVSVMVGERQNAVFRGLVYPPNYDAKTFERRVTLPGRMEEVTLWLLRNEEIEDVELSFPDDASVAPPTPYRHGPAVYYGSSITEGGCCCNVTNVYNAILCRWLDLDYYNLGFSGHARGELEMADYINTIDMRLFVYDYDHNAPDAAHLRRTHAPFFWRIREAHPDLPILMMSRPGFDAYGDAAERRAVIEETYRQAIAAGDRHVRCIDGETFFGKTDRELCTIDTTHPNDLGFYRMATVIRPVIEELLGIR